MIKLGEKTMKILRRTYRASELAKILGPEVNTRRVEGWVEKEILYPQGKKELVRSGTGTPREFDIANLIEAAIILEFQRYLSEKNVLIYQVKERREIAVKYEPYIRGEKDFFPKVFGKPIGDISRLTMLVMILPHGSKRRPMIRDGDLIHLLPSIWTSRWMGEELGASETMVILVNLKRILDEVRTRLMEFR